MNFNRAFVVGLALLLSTLIVHPASAAETEPLSIDIKNMFLVQQTNAKDCNNVKPYDQVDLLINGINTGFHALGCDPANGKLTFQLKRDPAVVYTDASNALWEAMLGNSWETLHTKKLRQFNYTITQPGSPIVDILNSGTFGLIIWHSGSTFLGILLILGIWVGIWILGRYTGMVRDAGNSGTDVTHRPYSLGRVQMAWWFGVVMGSYVFLWMITGEQPVLSAQALALMGLSGATGLTAAGLDAGKKTAMPISSGHFFIDLLTDSEGVTIYRFQMLVLTILFGVFFFCSVVNHLSMPAFDQSILTLLGISAGTYAGFKIPEKHGPPPDTSIDPAAQITP